MKTKLKYFLLFVLILFFSIKVKSQENWNLSKCINYAVENNIDLIIMENQVLKQEISLTESKAMLLPDLNIGSGLNLNYGRNIDGTTNDITYEQTLSNNYWLNSSVDLFRGFVKLNTIRLNRYMLLANMQEKEMLKNKLIFEIITSYYISVYTIGLERVAESQVELSEIQYKRMQKLVDVGKESQLSMQDLKSQWAADKLALTKAENQSTQQLLDLKQLLRLNNDVKFIIDTTGVNQLIIDNSKLLDVIFNNAVNLMPAIKQQEFLINANEKSLAISRGKISPRLYVSAGLNSYFFDGSILSFANQLKDNQNQYVNFGLVIPIFNNAFVQSDIKRKKIDLKNQKLQIEKQKDLLFSQIQKVYNNVESAESEYKSSLELYKYSKLSFYSVSKKLEHGLVSSSDFELAKQRLVSARVAMLKAKLTYVMNFQILEFYRTGNWEHLK